MRRPELHVPRKKTGRSQVVATVDLVPGYEAPLAETAFGPLLLGEQRIAISFLALFHEGLAQNAVALFIEIDLSQTHEASLALS